MLRSRFVLFFGRKENSVELTINQWTSKNKRIWILILQFIYDLGVTRTDPQLKKSPQKDMKKVKILLNDIKSKLIWNKM